VTPPCIYRRPRPMLGLAVALAVLTSCSQSGSGPAKAKGPVTPVDPSTAGSIEVQVSYSGTPPTPGVLNMSSVPACANLHPTPVLDPGLVVTDGRLANAVVYIKSGFGDRGFDAPADAVVIDQKGCLYDPRIAALMVGQPLQFRNSDTEAHNVHGRPRTVDAWNFLMSRPNSTRDVSFDKPEVGIPVSCDIHPWMRAYVSVFDNPYFAVTPRDGTVTLRSVPPGDYVVAVWHETLGTLVRSVSLPPSGAERVQFVFPASEKG
jgi:plastocyanin